MFSSRGFLKISQNIICRNGLKNSVRSTHIKTEYGNWGIPRKVIEHLMKKYPNAFIEQKTLYVGLNSDPFHVTKGGMELLNKGLEMTTMIDGEQYTISEEGLDFLKEIEGGMLKNYLKVSLGLGTYYIKPEKLYEILINEKNKEKKNMKINYILNGILLGIFLSGGGLLSVILSIAFLDS